MAAAQVSDAHSRLSFDSHVDVLHALIADWDDDALFSTPSNESRLVSRATGTPSAGDAVRESSVALLTTKASLHTTPRSPPSDPETTTAASSTSPSSPESDCSASSVRRTPPPQQTTKTPVPRKKRVLPKDEIARLRNQSKELEAQLLALREYWKSAPGRLHNNNDSSKSARAKAKRSTPHAPAWQAMAKHERELLTASEARNAALRAKYELNRKLARALRKMFTKRIAPTTVRLSRHCCGCSCARVL